MRRDRWHWLTDHQGKNLGACNGHRHVKEEIKLLLDWASSAAKRQESLFPAPPHPSQPHRQLRSEVRRLSPCFWLSQGS